MTLTKEDWRSKATNLRLRTQAFIGGQFVSAASGETMPSIDPSSGREIARISACGPEDVDRAVRAGRQAFEDGRWRDLPPRERKRVMLRLADAIEANGEELGLLETLEMGMPIGDSAGLFVPKAADMMRWYAEAIDKLYGEIAPTDPSVVALITRESLGVVGAVIPWNIPLYLAAYKLGPALATGNSVVLKPAEQSSLSALRLAELAAEAGLPEGVLNVVPGTGIGAGQALGRHMDVDCVTFTGSTEVAKRYLGYAAESNMKRVLLEGGGKSPNIVFADAPDLEEAAVQAAWGIFFNQGQICSAGSRLLVHRAVKEELLERLERVARAMRVGDPLDENTQIGALVSEQQLERVTRYVDSGEREGARLTLGGRRILEKSGGYYFEPTIFDGVRNDMTISREEIFGPVLSVISFDTPEDAVRLGNETIYGLGAAVWTRDIDKALRTAKALRAGQVWVNNYDASDLTVPWGGFKQSGNGRDKSLHALEEYTGLKATWIQVR